MKKFLGTRLATILITTLVVTVALSSIAYGAGVFNKPVTASATIIAGVPDLAFFSDQAMSEPITSIAFGEVKQGAAKQITIYVKNNGDLNLSSIAITDNLTAEVGNLTSVPTSITSLTKGQSTSVTFTLTPSVTAALGDIAPTVTFAGTSY